MDALDNQEVLVQNFSRLNGIADCWVKKRGDGTSLMAASCGNCTAIETLLDSFSALAVNQVNDQGETPLLCVCRAGHTDVVHLLLARGADAFIVTSSRESSLHWLISFEDAHIETVGAILLANGAELRLRTTKRIAYSRFPSRIELDYQQPGRPPNWAVLHDRPLTVKFLLGHAETAAICVDTVAPYLTPMQRAARYHHIECLESMIAAMREEKLGFAHSTFLEAATQSADGFSMMHRHGPQYKLKLRQTFDYLFQSTSGIIFSMGLGKFGYTLLYLAVPEARDAVVEYLLFHRKLKHYLPKKIHSITRNRPVRSSNG
jgi:Ankyrin repeats (3 copies)